MQQLSACEPWCETPKHCGNGVKLFVKCGGCAWCGEAAAGELLPAVYLPPPSPLPSPPPPLASWTETAETGASAAPGDDGSLSLSSSLAAPASWATTATLPSGQVFSESGVIEEINGLAFNQFLPLADGFQGHSGLFHDFHHAGVRSGCATGHFAQSFVLEKGF